MESGPGWARRETIETTLSAFGAGFAGLGVGLVLGIRHPAVGWTLLAAGILAHSMGMVFLHRRRQGHGDEQPKWLEYADWLCWGILVLVIGLVAWLASRWARQAGPPRAVSWLAKSRPAGPTLYSPAARFRFMRLLLVAAIALVALAAVPTAAADPLCDAGFRQTYSVERQEGYEVYVGTWHMATFDWMYTVESHPC